MALAGNREGGLEHGTGPAEPRPSADAIRAQLDRILAAAALQGSARRRKLLRFIVEETLAGRAHRLKGFSIATAALGRADDFDSGTDPIVRVEARRLRRDLDSYYSADGKLDPVVISIPKGGYVPHFAWREADAALAAPRPVAARPRRYPLAIVLLAIALLGVFGWLGTGLLGFGSSSVDVEDAATAMPRGPKIAVLPFSSLGDDREDAYLAEGLADQIVTDLARFKALSVLSMECTRRYREQPADPQDIRRRCGIDYLLTGSVQRNGDQIRLSTRLVDTGSGRIVWSHTYSDELTPSNVFEMREDLSQQVSAIIASNYGVIAEAGQTRAKRAPPTSLAAYDCVLRYYSYARSFDPKEHAEVRACLERAIETDPDYAEAWAVLANVYAQEYRFANNPRPELYDARKRSLDTAKRAVELEPLNPTAQLMLANALFDQHNLAGFRAAGEQAIALNPNDPEALAHYGVRLVFSGEWERGLALVTKAIALNPGHPSWYLDPFILVDYLQGEYQRAWAEAQSQGEYHDVWWLLFRVMILGQLGRSEQARPLIDAALQLEPDVSASLWDMARSWNIPEPHVEQIADGLRKAGLAIEPPPV
ncbi:MAG: tetratricopeptide repeat protein [Geminicoccaceae bacterium]